MFVQRYFKKTTFQIKMTLIMFFILLLAYFDTIILTITPYYLILFAHFDTIYHLNISYCASKCMAEPAKESGASSSFFEVFNNR